MATYDSRPSGFTQLTTTSDWESFMSAAGIWDGIDSQNSFQVSLDTVGRNIVMTYGACLIKGQLWRTDANVSTPIPAAAAQNRMDRLVLRYNRGATSSPTVVAPVVITGTPSGTPTLPPIVQTLTGIYDIPVCYWTSASTGALTGLVDQRQYSGRTVVSMTSTYHPSPSNPCMGIEIDTGRTFLWDGSAWNFVGPISTSVYGGATNNTTSMNSMFTPVSIPANDAVLNCGYHFACGGHGTQATTTAVTLNWQLYAFGLAWSLTGMSATGAPVPGGNFHWTFDGRLVIGPPGVSAAGAFYGTFTWSFGGTGASSASIAADQQRPNGVDTTTATNGTLQAGWASVTGSPTLVCTGGTMTRESR